MDFLLTIILLVVSHHVRNAGPSRPAPKPMDCVLFQVIPCPD
jgi:hypothetical protein